MVLAIGCADRPLHVPELPPARDGAADDAAADSPDGALADLRSSDLTTSDLALVDDNLPPPRPIAPLSTSRVTSRRPTLHWALVPDTDGARVELCRDRACASSIEVIDATGASGQPAADLPAGVVYWRLRSLRAGVPGATPGPTWQMTVGARSAPVDTSWGASLDLNGDGYSELALSQFIDIAWPNQTSAVQIYHGGPNGLASSPTQTLTTADKNDFFGFDATVNAGDVDGDGFGDLLISALIGGLDAGPPFSRLLLYRGGPAGVGDLPSSAIDLPDYLYDGSPQVAGGGDLDGDGYADIVVGLPSLDNNRGIAIVYFGGENGLDAGRSMTLLNPDDPSTISFGDRVVELGDLNGDGYADLAISSNYTLLTQLYLGSPHGPMAAGSLKGADDVFNDYSVGDVDGDGRADVGLCLLSGTGGLLDGTVQLFLGESDGLATTAAFTVGPGFAPAPFFGNWGTGVGDVDGDGYLDVVFAGDDEGVTSPAYLFRGGPMGLSATPSVVLHGMGGTFAPSTMSYKDFNGDGYDDLALVEANNGADDVPGCVAVYYGSSAGPIAPAQTSFCGGADDSFAMQVASNQCFDRGARPL